MNNSKFFKEKNNKFAIKLWTAAQHIIDN